mgnify:CR=1 FL=1
MKRRFVSHRLFRAEVKITEVAEPDCFVRSVDATDCNLKAKQVRAVVRTAEHVKQLSNVTAKAI